jgi:hypothetical protein
MKPLPISAVFCLSLLALPSAMGALITDFSSPTAFADNFRSVLDDGNTTTLQNGNFVSNIAVNPSASGGAEIFVYDTTPGDSTTGTQSTFSGSSIISFDIRAAQANSSFAILIINPADEAGAVHQYALFNFDNSTPGGDRIRIGSGAQIIGGSGIGNVALDISEDTPVTVGTAFNTATLTYSQGLNNAAVITFSIGAFTRTATLANNSYLANFEVGVRAFDAVNTTEGGVDFTNFNVSQVPEPSSLALLGLGTLGVLARRSRAGR